MSVCGRSPDTSHPWVYFAGPMCEACASGFYLRPDRTCGKCPELSGSSSAAERLRAALPFSAALVATCLIVTVLVAKVERMSGEQNTRRVWMEVTPQLLRLGVRASCGRV